MTLLAPFLKLRQTLGRQGLAIALITLVSFTFGVGMLIRESTRPHQTRREVLRSILASWINAPDHLGLTVMDHGRRSLGFTADAPPARLDAELERLGEELEDHDKRFPLIAILGLTLEDSDLDGRRVVAEWRPRFVDAPGPAAEVEDFPIGGSTSGRILRLKVTYQAAKSVDTVFLAAERFDGLLLQALIGLSGCSLLCFGYMVLYVSELRERVARESAQEATLDLADRTCHELGNVAFVVANERRNLFAYVELIERYLDEEPSARRAAAERAGLDPATVARHDAALRREFETRGIAPDFELRRGNELAKRVCRQIAVCSDYITLTVRDLDGYLKRSLTHESTPTREEPVAASELFDEALALSAPRIQAAEAVVVRTEAVPSPTTLVDRHLIVHVLVNLIKNALESSPEPDRAPRIELIARRVEGMVELSVADDGRGLDEAALRRVFEDGFSTKGSGRGRGLAIARESVRSQGGTISVESESGRGAVFRVRVKDGASSTTENPHGVG